MISETSRGQDATRQPKKLDSDLARTIWIDRDGMPWRWIEGRNPEQTDAYEKMPDVWGIPVHEVSNRRRQQGVWGYYGDRPFILGSWTKKGVELGESPDHKSRAFELEGRPLKRKTW